jgi:uncharacterized alkaline shock family protein YloU
VNKHFNQDNLSKVDTKEFELPVTIYERDIEDRVFQGIVLQCLTKIDGIALPEGTFIDNILGRKGSESPKLVSVIQDSKNHSVEIKIEINICFGVSIPEKADEIQSLVAKEITKITGLHVKKIHVVFKNVVPADAKTVAHTFQSPLTAPIAAATSVEEEYSDEF